MKITLRKASALQNAIQEAIKTIEIKLSISINEFQDFKAELACANEGVIKNDVRRGLLTVALYTIRGQVGVANSTSGISDRLADCAYLDKRIGQLQGLISSVTQENEVVMEGKLNKIRNRKEDSRNIYGREDEVSTGVLTAEQIEHFKNTQRDLKKRKQKLNDELLELNVRTEIDLAEDIVETLNTEGLL